MNIEFDKFRTAIESQEDCEIPEFLLSTPFEYQVWLDKQGLPEELSHFLSATALDEECPIGVSTLFPWDKVMENNDEYPILIRCGLIQIGSAPNGDPLAIEWKKSNGGVGYVCHDKLWSQPDKIDPITIFKQLASSIGEFAERACPIVGFPMDYHGNIAS